MRPGGAGIWALAVLATATALQHAVVPPHHPMRLSSASPERMIVPETNNLRRPRKSRLSAPSSFVGRCWTAILPSRDDEAAAEAPELESAVEAKERRDQSRDDLIERIL